MAFKPEILSLSNYSLQLTPNGQILSQTLVMGHFELGPLLQIGTGRSLKCAHPSQDDRRDS